MKLKRFNTLNEKSALDSLRDEQEKIDKYKVDKIVKNDGKSALDSLRDEQEKIDKERRVKELELDNKRKEEIANHLNIFKEEPIGINKLPDFNVIKKQFSDRISKILFHFLKEGDNTVKTELGNFINRYSHFLKTKGVEPIYKLDTLTEFVDKIGEILFYSLKEGNNNVKKELEAFINRYSHLNTKSSVKKFNEFEGFEEFKNNIVQMAINHDDIRAYMKK